MANNNALNFGNRRVGITPSSRLASLAPDPASDLTMAVVSPDASMRATSSAFVFADRADELESVLRRGSSFKSYAAVDTEGPYIIKMSFRENADEDPVQWLRRRILEADVHADVGRHVPDIVPQLYFAGYDPTSRLFYHVMECPEDMQDLVPLDELVKQRWIRPEIYRSLESSIRQLWEVGAVHVDQTSRSLLYSRETNTTYVPDFASVVPLIQAKRQQLADQWNQWVDNGTITVNDRGIVTKGTENIPHLAKLWGMLNTGANPIQTALLDRARALYGLENADYPDWVMLRDVFQAIDPNAPVLRRKDIVRPSGVSFEGAGSARPKWAVSPGAVKRIIPRINKTRPVLRRVKTSTDPSVDGWIPRQHGRSWTTIFFKALSEGGGGPKKRTPAQRTLRLDADDGAVGTFDAVDGNGGDEMFYTAAEPPLTRPLGNGENVGTNDEVFDEATDTCERVTDAVAAEVTAYIPRAMRDIDPTDLFAYVMKTTPDAQTDTLVTAFHETRAQLIVGSICRALGIGTETPSTSETITPDTLYARAQVTAATYDASMDAFTAAKSDPACGPLVAAWYAQAQKRAVPYVDLLKRVTGALDEPSLRTFGATVLTKARTRWQRLRNYAASFVGGAQDVTTEGVTIASELGLAVAAVGDDDASVTLPRIAAWYASLERDPDDVARRAETLLRRYKYSNRNAAVKTTVDAVIAAWTGISAGPR